MKKIFGLLFICSIVSTSAFARSNTSWKGGGKFGGDLEVVGDLTVGSDLTMTGDVSLKDVSIDGLVTNVPSASTDIVSASSNTTLAITNSVMYLHPRLENITFISTPFISTATATHADETSVMIVNVGTYTLTIQDNDTLPNSCVETLGNLNIVLSEGGRVVLTKRAGKWHQVATTQTGTDVTLSGTLQAEQLTSTDDATIADDLAVGGLVTIGETLTVTGAQTLTGHTALAGNLTMGTATADSGVFSMIKGTTGSDPTFSITNAASAVTLGYTVGDILITAADDIVITATGNDIGLVGNTAITGTASVSSSLAVTGALKESVTTITTAGAAASQTLTPAQGGYVVVKATEAVTLVLPAVSGNAGLKYIVKLSSVAATAPYAVTLDGNASETIDGATTNAQINDWYDYLGIVTDGSEWFTFLEKEH